MNLDNLHAPKAYMFWYMFCDCDLTAVDFSKATLGTEAAYVNAQTQSMFSGNLNLKEVKLGPITKGLTLIKCAAMFYNCKSLTMDCSSWDVSHVSDHEDFAYNAPGVVEPKWLDSTPSDADAQP